VLFYRDVYYGGKNAPNAPTDKGYTKIYSNTYAFAALGADGSIATWGDIDSGAAKAYSFEEISV
jgi:hypothetical protein